MRVGVTEQQYQQIEQAVLNSLTGKGNSVFPENCYGFRNDVYLVGGPNQPGDRAVFSASPIFEEDVDGPKGWRLWYAWRDTIVKDGRCYARRWSNGIGVGMPNYPSGTTPVRQAVDALIENSDENEAVYPDSELMPIEEEPVSELTEYAQDKAAGDASYAAQQKSLADVLIEIAEKAAVQINWGSVESYPFTFNGWQLLADYEQGEFHQLAYFINPKGEHVDLRAWPDCHDRTRLLAWRPSK